MGSPGPPGPPGPSSRPHLGISTANLLNLFSTSTQFTKLFDFTSERYKNLDLSTRLNNYQAPQETATKFLEDLKRLSNDITLKQKPDGSKMHPVRSCRDISDYYPEKPNGLIYMFTCFSIILFATLTS